jgi:hypothetical protein
MSRALVMSVVALAAVGCGPAKVPGGTVQCGFGVSDQVRTNPALKSPLKGTVYGNLFLQEDVAVDGPRAGSTQYGDVEIAVDLTTATSSDAKWTSGTLAPGKYVFLGFFDVNGNAGTAKEPDPGDPVTLALTNKFDITDGAVTKRAVLFELVFN